MKSVQFFGEVPEASKPLKIDWFKNWLLSFPGLPLLEVTDPSIGKGKSSTQKYPLEG